MSPKNRSHLRPVPPPDERQEKPDLTPAQLLPADEFLAPPGDIQGTELDIWIELRTAHGDRLSEADRGLFRKLVENESDYRTSRKKVLEIGALIKSPTGYPIQNPHVALAKSAENRGLRIMVQLGLTPLSRGRIKANRNKQLRTNPFQDLRTLND